MQNPELKDVQKKDIKNPDKASEIYTEFRNKLDEYVSYAYSGDLAFMVDDPAITKMFLEKIKPYNDKIQPLMDEHIAIANELDAIETKRKELHTKWEEKDKEIKAIEIKRNKFITRISPMIIRKYQDRINEYQQFGSIIEQDGDVFVTVKDWLASFINGFKQKASAHAEKVTNKITNNKIVANE